MALPPTDPDPLIHKSFRGDFAWTVEGPVRGPAVLCVHGAPGSVRDFRYLAPEIAAHGARVYRVDMPGFGRTPRGTWPAAGSEARAGFLAFVSQQLRLERPALVGHSIGGPPCLIAAGLGQGRVAALCLINSAGVERHRGMSAPEQVGRLLSQALRVPALSTKLVPNLRRNFGRLGFREAERYGPEDFALFASVLGGLDFALHRAAARTLSCPVLVASAADDPLVESARSHALAAAITDGVQSVHLHFARGGHYLQKHEAAKIAASLAQLLGLDALGLSARR